MFKSILAIAAAFVFAAGTAQFAKADPVGGTQSGRYVVKANTTDVFNIKFRANEQTRIRIAGDGDTCLELRVYDENGNLVASDTVGMGDTRTCSVTPKWTGKFTIKVKNIGGVGNDYAIVVD